MKHDGDTILDKWANGESVFVNCCYISDILVFRFIERLVQHV